MLSKRQNIHRTQNMGQAKYRSQITEVTKYRKTKYESAKCRTQHNEVTRYGKLQLKSPGFSLPRNAIFQL